MIVKKQPDNLLGFRHDFFRKLDECISGVEGVEHVWDQADSFSDSAHGFVRIKYYRLASIGITIASETDFTIYPITNLISGKGRAYKSEQDCINGIIDTIELIKKAAKKHLHNDQFYEM